MTKPKRRRYRPDELVKTGQSKGVYQTHQRGDIVRLASGGPDMCIVSVVGELARCSWRDAQGLRHEAEFICVTLERQSRGLFDSNN